MTGEMLIDGSLRFMVQQQRAHVVIQCMECGVWQRVLSPRVAHRWQKHHLETCQGDDGSDELAKESV